ncbi:MAG: histidine triad nucleotide-binding protein [Clostridia bacterium]|nr:histidine triad nucleotide-binding protein [Clostridia bacterium]
MDCLFCKIISRDVPATIVYENEYVIAFKDIYPVAPVHILVVPKTHIKSMNEVDDTNSNYIAKIYEAIPEVAKIAGVFDNGYRVICNAGEDGGQMVQHIHFHLLGGKHLGAKILRD